MFNLLEIAGLILFILAGRLFLRTFKAKPDGWQARCLIYFTISMVAFVAIAFDFLPDPFNAGNSGQ
jgi:hypothetical protein